MIDISHEKRINNHKKQKIAHCIEDYDIIEKKSMNIQNKIKKKTPISHICFIQKNSIKILF